LQQLARTGRAERRGIDPAPVGSGTRGGTTVGSYEVPRHPRIAHGPGRVLPRGGLAAQSGISPGRTVSHHRSVSTRWQAGVDPRHHGVVATLVDLSIAIIGAPVRELRPGVEQRAAVLE